MMCIAITAESQNMQGGTGINFYAGKILEWQRAL
jgi:hypothetical protein